MTKISQRTSRLVIALAALAIVALAVFAIRGFRNEPAVITETVTPAKVERIRVAHLPIADCAQLFVALDRGYFKDEGLEVDARVFPSGVKAIEALGTGDVDIAYAAIAPLMLARSRGLDFVALTGGPVEDASHAEHSILVKNEGPIQTPKDLEGKTIAIVAFRSIDEPFVKEWLQKEGVNVSKVTLVEVPFPQMETVLLSDRIAAAAAIEPFVTVARRNGKTKVLAQNFVKVRPTTEIGSYNAREQALQTNGAALAKFQRAIARATEYANQYPNEVRTIVARHAKIDPAIANEMALPLYSARLTPEGVSAVADLMQKWKILEQPFDVRQIIR